MKILITNKEKFKLIELGKNYSIREIKVSMSNIDTNIIIMINNFDGNETKMLIINPGDTIKIKDGNEIYTLITSKEDDDIKMYEYMEKIQEALFSIDTTEI